MSPFAPRKFAAFAERKATNAEVILPPNLSSLNYRGRRSADFAAKWRSKALSRKVFRQSAKNSLAKSRRAWILMYRSGRWTVVSATLSVPSGQRQGGRWPGIAPPCRSRSLVRLDERKEDERKENERYLPFRHFPFFHTFGPFSQSPETHGATADKTCKFGEELSKTASIVIMGTAIEA